MVCVCILFHSYDYRQNNIFIYQQDSDMNSKLKMIQSTDVRMYTSNKDTVTKLVKNYNETNHEVKKPAIAHVQDTRSFYQNNENWQKTNLKPLTNPITQKKSKK